MRRNNHNPSAIEVPQSIPPGLRPQLVVSVEYSVHVMKKGRSESPVPDQLARKSIGKQQAQGGSFEKIDNLHYKIIGLGIIGWDSRRWREAHEMDYDPAVIPVRIPMPADKRCHAL